MLINNEWVALIIAAWRGLIFWLDITHSYIKIDQQNFTVCLKEVIFRSELEPAFCEVICSLAPRRALFRTHSAPWCPRLRIFSPQYQRGTSDWEQQKHVREVEPLLATADCCHRNKSSLRRTAIWFPSWQRPTTQKDGTESTGIHCWSSLHRDLSCAGKPPLELAGSADA